MRYAVATFVAAALAGLSSAYTQPKGPDPIGNPFKTPELATQVPKGKPFEVTWEPTIDKAGTVTILLLRGPSENAVPQYAIAEKIPNSGSFSWTPSNDLEVDTTHYGLQLVVDASGQYQYTPQFGISGKKTSGGETSSAPKPSSYEVSSAPTIVSSRPEEPPKATSTPAYTEVEPSGTAVPPAPSSSKTGPVYLTTTMDVTTCTTSTAGSATAPAASGTGVPVPPGNPGLPSVPVGTAPGAGSNGTSTAPVPGQSTIATGAAGKTMVASGAAIVAAVFALAL